ncbi:MAG TPA: hypothetical protein VND64_12565 [Pirellulales bacterium]|nr:hypothetical protein [Pirellulales bacterium]
MASVDTSLVRKELKAIAARSKVVRKLLYEALEGLEEDPSQYSELEMYPAELRQKYPDVVLRKVYIEHNPHNYRLVFIHWTFEDSSEHVDVIYAFPRKRGYPIDWEQVEQFLRDA